MFCGLSKLWFRRFVQVAAAILSAQSAAPESIQEGHSDSEREIDQVRGECVEEINGLGVHCHHYFRLRKPRVLNDDARKAAGRELWQVAWELEPCLVRRSLKNLGFNSSRKDRADVDLIRHHLGPQRLGKSGECELACAISGLVWNATLPHDRRYIDNDAACRLAPHLAHCGFRGINSAPEIHIHHPAEIFDGLVLKASRQPNTGVVDKSVEPAKVLDCLLH